MVLYLFPEHAVILSKHFPYARGLYYGTVRDTLFFVDDRVLTAEHLLIKLKKRELQE